MRSAPISAMLAAIIAPGAGAVVALAQSPADATVECRFEGWSNDLDEKGQPVRAEPDRSATVVGRLPAPVSVGLDDLSVTVKVSGYRNGWFRIAEAGYSDEVQGVAVPRRPVLTASGWIPAGGVKSLLASNALKAEPSRDARTLAALSGFRRDPSGGQVGFGPDGVAVKRLLSCRGTWVEIETEFGLGWVERVCARQLSPCP